MGSIINESFKNKIYTIHKNDNYYNKFYTLLFEFTTYGIMGWLYEAIATIIKCNVFENRGFLHMAVLPIYGLFAFLIILIFRNRNYGVIKTFFMSMAVVSALEYISSLLIEAVLGKRLWNYEEWFCNLHGRIALVSSIIFGVCCVLLLKFIHPFLYKLFNEKMGDKTVKALGAFMVVIYIFDLAWTITEYM